MAYGIPIPITLIVDSKGTVDSKFLDQDYRQRYTAANILARRYGVKFQASMDETVAKHVRIVSSASNSSVRGGQHVALILDVELQPGIHVYAPGVQSGYIPIEWKLSTSPTWTNTTVDYPEPKRVQLLGEMVPAYEGKMRITREVTIAPQRRAAEAANAAGEFVIEGSFRYQACDDRQCFIPETVPLKWSFHLGQMDTERAPAELRRK
jgi:DsbC/DsbD-like thiol-disulfide interchange protein